MGADGCSVECPFPSPELQGVWGKTQSLRTERSVRSKEGEKGGSWGSSRCPPQSASEQRLSAVPKARPLQMKSQLCPHFPKPNINIPSRVLGVPCRTSRQIDTWTVTHFITPQMFVQRFSTQLCAENEPELRDPGAPRVLCGRKTS